MHAPARNEANVAPHGATKSHAAPQGHGGKAAERTHGDVPEGAGMFPNVPECSTTCVTRAANAGAERSQCGARVAQAA